VLTALCEQIENTPISGVIVVGDGQAARSIALSGNAMKVPVLWAKGGTAQLHAGGSEVSRFNLVFNISQSALFMTLVVFLLVAQIPSYHMSDKSFIVSLLDYHP
jgi:hypothetical protein